MDAQARSHPPGLLNLTGYSGARVRRSVTHERRRTPGHGPSGRDGRGSSCDLRHRRAGLRDTAAAGTDRVRPADQLREGPASSRTTRPTTTWCARLTGSAHQGAISASGANPQAGVDVQADPALARHAPADAPPGRLPAESRSAVRPPAGTRTLARHRRRRCRRSRVRVRREHATNTGNGFYGSTSSSSRPGTASAARQPSRCLTGRAGQRAAMLYAREGASPWPVCGR